MFVQRGNKIETTVYRKSTNNGIYLNWGSFAVTWKRGTLKTLFNRAYIVCSTHYLFKEGTRPFKMFFRNNNYSKWIIKQATKQVKDQKIQSNADGTPTVANELPSSSKSFTLVPPYTGQKGEHLIRSLRKDMSRMLPENVQTRICYTSTELGAKFNNIKDPVKNPTNTT